LFGRRLRAQVAAADVGRAHVGEDQLEHVVLEPHRRDDDPLLVDVAGVGGHRAGPHAADVGVVGARDRVGEDVAVDVERRDERDVRQVGAAAVGVVDDPHVAGVGLVLDHRRHRLGHRAEVDGDVLGLGDHRALGVEQRGRAVAALLDVGGVGAADQHRAGLLGDARQRAGEHAQRDGIKAHRRSSTSVPALSTAPDQPGRTTQVASANSTIAGPSTSKPSPMPARR
jgi:hypothetical protein